MVLCAVIVMGLFLSHQAGAHSGSAHDEVGLDQKLGSLVALDSHFTGEEGEPLVLRSLVTTPTVLAFVYYECANTCDLLLTGIAEVVGRLDARPGTDYNVVTISVSPRETPQDARKARRISLESIQKPFPADSWRFLTGDEQSIHAVADSVGFHYRESADGYDHPVAIAVLSPSGKIVRYMFGYEFVPADLKLSLMEAEQGTIGPTIAKLARICFRVDPKSHTLVFRTTQVVATVTLACAGALVLYLVLAARRRRRLSGS